MAAISADARSPEQPRTPATETISTPTRADAVHRVGPEGTPAVGAASPRGLRILVLGVATLLLAAAVLVAAFFNVVAGAMLAGIAVLAILLNPAAASAMLRANDREVANRIVDGAESSATVPPPSPELREDVLSARDAGR